MSCLQKYLLKTDARKDFFLVFIANPIISSSYLIHK